MDLVHLELICSRSYGRELHSENAWLRFLPGIPPAGVEVAYTTGMFQRTVPANEKIEILRVTINTSSHLSFSYLNQGQAKHPKYSNKGWLFRYLRRYI